MAHERPPLVLRPIHGWFQLWEAIVPSVYRVIAVVVAVLATAILAVLATRVHWLLALVLAAGIWIALAVVEEHDGRVVLDVDDEFLSLLRSQVDGVLGRAGFVFRTAFGPARARHNRSDTFLYEADSDDGCVDLWIRRDRAAGGELEVLVDGRPLEWLLESRGESHLAKRITWTEDAAADAAVLVSAFELIFSNE